MVETSPLAEASPDALQELFNREPESLTDPEITSMVRALRKQREQWNLTETAKKTKPKLSADPSAIEDLLKDL